MLTMHSYHSLIKSVLFQKKPRLQEAKKHTKVWLSHRELVYQEGGPGLISNASKDRRERRERAKERGGGEGEGGKRGEKKIACACKT